MARRPSRRRVRRVLRFFLVAFASFAAWGLLGVTVATVGEGAVPPLFETGDLVTLRSARRSVYRGSIVMARNPFPDETAPFADVTRRIWGGTQGDETAPLYHDRDVLRVVAALPGDRVTWDHARIVVRTSEGGLYRLEGGIIHTVVEYEQRQTTVPEGYVFLVALDSGRIDSRITGPVPMRSIRRRVERIVWPRDRRRPVELLEDGFLLPNGERQS